jgi:hypothetical protein
MSVVEVEPFLVESCAVLVKAMPDTLWHEYFPTLMMCMSIRTYMSSIISSCTRVIPSGPHLELPIPLSRSPARPPARRRRCSPRAHAWRATRVREGCSRVPASRPRRGTRSQSRCRRTAPAWVHGRARSRARRRRVRRMRRGVVASSQILRQRERRGPRKDGGWAMMLTEDLQGEMVLVRGEAVGRTEYVVCD